MYSILEIDGMILDRGVLPLDFGCIVHHYSHLSHHKGGYKIVGHEGDMKGIPDD